MDILVGMNLILHGRRSTNQVYLRCKNFCGDPERQDSDTFNDVNCISNISFNIKFP